MRVYAFADEASAFVAGQIAAMRRNGLNGLEIRNVEGTNVSDLPIAKAKEIRNRLEGAGLIVWSIGSPIGKIHISDNFPAHRERFLHTLEVAETMNAENIRLFSFYPDAGMEKDAFRDAAFERLNALIDAAKGAKVALCHENEKGIYGDKADRCAEIHAAFPSLRAVFDPANFIQCGQETLSAWKMLKGYVKYLHIKDALPDGRVVPAGKGIGNVNAILSDFIAHGGKDVTIEPHLKVFDGLNALERDQQRSAVGGYLYETNDQAFDAACAALRELLEGGKA